MANKKSSPMKNRAGGAPAKKTKKREAKKKRPC